jgi:hypothetical protein
MASLHAEAAVVSKPQATIPASFRGHVQTNGSALTVTGLTGTIAGSRFTGYGTGTSVGKVFAGGTVHLSNGAGSIELSLSPVFTVKVGRTSRQEVAVKVISVSPNYGPYLNMTGTLTKWNLPARAGATASFSGFFA